MSRTRSYAEQRQETARRVAAQQRTEAARQAHQARLARQQDHRLRKHHRPVLFRWLAARGGQRG